MQAQDGTMWRCRIKGKFKIDFEITSTNPLAVGDFISFDIEDEATNIGTITTIDSRKNYVTRVSPHNKHLKHIIASNMDLAMLIATIKQPKTSLGFIDRFIITCEMFGVQPLIIFNKVDVLKAKDMELLNHYKNIYNSINYEVLHVSAKTEQGMDALVAKLQNKTVLLSGHSGVGKSSIINYLLPNLKLKTLEVSQSSGKGMHTTTYAEMHVLNATTKIIDTPGIRELGLVDITVEELPGYYKEMSALQNNCKYNNCSHIHEPGCAVQDALVNKQIPMERFETYLTIRDSIGKEW